LSTLAAVALGHRVRELNVGDRPVLTVRTGAFVLRLGALTGKSDFAGYVIYDGTRAGAWHLLLIAFAGPLASPAVPSSPRGPTSPSSAIRSSISRL
jgi:hypothetical protein